VLDLAGQGRVALDAPVITQVAADIAELVGRFEHGQVITVRQLLHHRSGLVDHTMFPEFELPPTTQWTAVQQLAIAVSKPALFDPGTAFSYSDSGYVLLGQLVEHLTGEPLAAAVRRSAAIDTASTPSIHWETAEPTPPGLQRAHQLYEDHDTHDWNPSLDMFGGGGLVATLPDLARWWSAWFASDRVDAHLASIESTTLASGEPFAAGPQVGLGLFGRTVSGHHVWSHGGFWGLETAHVPDLGVSVAVAHTHRATGLPSARPLADAVIDAIS
jgi:D-alanyl-D-alanine carboxypeptidase